MHCGPLGNGGSYYLRVFHYHVKHIIYTARLQTAALTAVITLLNIYLHPISGLNAGNFVEQTSNVAAPLVRLIGQTKQSVAL